MAKKKKSKVKKPFLQRLYHGLKVVIGVLATIKIVLMAVAYFFPVQFLAFLSMLPKELYQIPVLLQQYPTFWQVWSYLWPRAWMGIPLLILLKILENGFNWIVPNLKHLLVSTFHFVVNLFAELFQQLSAGGGKVADTATKTQIRPLSLHNCQYLLLYYDDQEHLVNIKEKRKYLCEDGSISFQRDDSGEVSLFYQNEKICVLHNREPVINPQVPHSGITLPIEAKLINN